MTPHVFAPLRAAAGLLLVTTALLFAPSACSSPADKPADKGADPAAEALPPSGRPDAPLPDIKSPYDAIPAESRSLLMQPFTGDFDEMVKRRIIRAGVVFNRTQYFIDQGQQRGMSYESLKLFEDELNKRLKTGLLHVHVAIVPLGRDELFPALQKGLVDLVAAALTITPERQKVAAFSTPTRTGVSEVPVTKKGAPAIASADDLSGREVYVRRSSSYYESLQQLNASLKQRGRAEVTIKVAPEELEDDDVLEMVNAGLVDITVVDDFVVDFWDQVFTSLQAHPAAAVRTGGEIAVAVRQDNPKLRQAVNTWIKSYGPKTAFGNLMDRRYLQSANYVKNAGDEAERKKFLQIVKLFETYGGKYGLDPVMIAAQGYQESRLDHSAKSHVGAIGIMQVMPATGKDLKVGDIQQLEANIHAGTKYVRLMMDHYYKNEPMDPLNKFLITMASYNAGPGRLRQLRAEAAKRGLNPNVWFKNVEQVASERIGRETVQYVSNIYKYYIAYKLMLDQNAARARAKGSTH
jgi:membrane-bound lytic murein transglycosylase MltF